MKKQLSLFSWALAVFGMAAVLSPAVSVAATNSGAGGASVANLTDGPDSRAAAAPAKTGATKKITYEKYETTTSSKTVKSSAGNSGKIYYMAPQKRAEAQPVAADATHTAYTEPKSGRAETTKVAEGRKYYLLHPFFQPAQGRFGSLTDLSLSNVNYKFGDISCSGCAINSGSGLPGWEGYGGKWNADSVAIKEDISFGITDKLALIGSARWANTGYSITWNANNVAKDKQRDTGIDLWGLGLQWRFYDDADWIAYIGAYYQWQEIANTFAADAKVGYKIQNSTIYGLARMYSVNYDNSSYGNGISNNGQSLFFALDTDAKNSVYIEGGIGLFSVLAPDWTLNLEAIIGDYGWHSQGSIKAALGWQPTDSFALNLYGRMSVYDSADGKDGIGIYDWLHSNPAAVSYEGTMTISKYRETAIGLQAALYF